MIRLISADTKFMAYELIVYLLIIRHFGITPMIKTDKIKCIMPPFNRLVLNFNKK